MNEFIEFIKKIWENKRTRALTILILYFISFIFVFSTINSSNKSLEYKKDKLDILNKTNNYSLSFTGIYNFTVLNNIISYNEIEYNLEDKPLELSNCDIAIYKPSNIYKLLKLGVLESTNYVDNNDTYLIKVSDFEKIIYDNDVISDKNIRITINKKEIKEIIIDLSEYYEYNVKIELGS